LRLCFILLLAAPAFAASETDVRSDLRSGRLVRTSVSVAPEPSEVAALINRIALEEGVEDALVHSVIRAESNYNARAVSPKGALGLMQLIPSTARRFGVSDPFDPKDNIQGGVRYLRFLLEYYNNDYAKAVAAYNAGEGAVDKYHGIPPFPETRSYVIRVAKNLKVARQVRAQQAPPEPAAVETAETHRPIQASVGEDGLVYYRTQ
jgi:soluble lytic murein transglycosylase-like protein